MYVIYIYIDQMFTEIHKQWEGLEITNKEN